MTPTFEEGDVKDMGVTAPPSTTLEHPALWPQLHAVTDSESHIYTVLFQVQTQFPNVKLCRWGGMQTAERMLSESLSLLVMVSDVC